MTTISERLQEYKGDVVERSTIEALVTAIDQQMTIDALVAALERIVVRSHNDPLGTSKVTDMRREAEAALALVRGSK